MRGLAAIALVLVACKPGKGERCLCEDECKNGLQCVSPDGPVMGCIAPAPGEPAGTCVEAEEEMNATEAFDPRPDDEPRLDLGVGPPDLPAATESGSTATATETGTGTSSESGTGTTVATGTGESTSTGSTGTSESSGSSGSSSSGDQTGSSTGSSTGG